MTMMMKKKKKKSDGASVEKSQRERVFEEKAPSQAREEPGESVPADDAKSGRLARRCHLLASRIEHGEPTRVMRRCVGSVHEYVSVLKAALGFEKNLVVCRHFENQRASVWLPLTPTGDDHDHGPGSDQRRPRPRRRRRRGSSRSRSRASPFFAGPFAQAAKAGGTIDMWVVDGIGADNPMRMSWKRFAVSPAALMMELMHIIRTKLRRGGRGELTLRVMRVVEDEAAVEEARERIEGHLKEARIDAEVVAIPLSSHGMVNGSCAYLRLAPLARCEVVNKIIRRESAAADLVVLRLPEFSFAKGNEEWWRQVVVLTNELPPTAMLSVGDTSSAVIARDI
eukprot:CAMPEP_0167778778 /NCGR_PEP_ID=MMETSP0111_2-20121227/4445_1 /TAXON_ID=91324 /ORGANISM="Lotharella globosa, Strain CCCM811" /LENGTH=338 /DNA_ID=CAMNT_0007669125 /DNA_START=17 /DNA_END=1033 /DNA_ORIENTATION=+